jgi:tetratricopeptide (TPR) repeat protein
LLSALPTDKFTAHIAASYLTLINLANVQRLRGQNDGAHGNLLQALSIIKKHPNLDGADRLLGRIYRELGLIVEIEEDYSTAKSWYEQSTEAYRQARKSSKDTDPYVLTNTGYEESGALYALATMQVKLNELNEASTTFFECFERTKESFGPTSVNAAECAVEYGRLLIQIGRQAEAQQILMAALEIYSEKQDVRLNEVLPIYLSTMEGMNEMLDDLIAQESNPENNNKESK